FKEPHPAAVALPSGARRGFGCRRPQPAPPRSPNVRSAVRSAFATAVLSSCGDELVILAEVGALTSDKRRRATSMSALFLREHGQKYSFFANLCARSSRFPERVHARRELRVPCAPDAVDSLAAPGIDGDLAPPL